MKTQQQILTKLEIIADMKHQLAMKDDKTDFERLCILQYESNMKELAWVLDINVDPTIRDEETQRDFMDEMRSDMQEEGVDEETYEKDSLSI